MEEVVEDVLEHGRPVQVLAASDQDLRLRGVTRDLPSSDRVSEQKNCALRFLYLECWNLLSVGGLMGSLVQPQELQRSLRSRGEAGNVARNVNRALKGTGAGQVRAGDVQGRELTST